MWRAAFLFLVVIGALVAVLGVTAGIGLWQAARLHAGTGSDPAASPTAAPTVAAPTPAPATRPATAPAATPPVESAAPSGLKVDIGPAKARAGDAWGGGGVPADPDPPVPRAVKSKQVVLAAKDAVVVGDELRLEGDARSKVATNWRARGDGLEWSVVAPQAGLYEAEVEYACHPEEGGGIVSLGTGRGRAAAAVRPTAGWDDYRTARVGIVTLWAGDNTVSVRPTWLVPGRPLMNLRSVRLTLLRAHDELPQPDREPELPRRFRPRGPLREGW